MYGLSIRFYCGDIKAIQCLLHRVLSFVYCHGNVVYAPNPRSHVESRLGVNTQSVYHLLGGDGVAQSPSVVTQVPLANRSSFFIDPEAIRMSFVQSTELTQRM